MQTERKEGAENKLHFLKGRDFFLPRNSAGQTCATLADVPEKELIFQPTQVSPEPRVPKLVHGHARIPDTQDGCSPWAPLPVSYSSSYP